MKPPHFLSRKNGDKLVVDQAQRQVQTFFDELKNGTQNYRTIASLDAQIAQAYRGRCILELLQNAHDALEHAPLDDARIVSFLLRTGPRPVLLIGNSGAPFRRENFEGLCQLGQSPKDPNESVGNKGLGFRSVLEISASPEIWSTPPIGSQMSFAFRFDPSVPGQVADAAEQLDRIGLDARSPFDPNRPLLDWSEEQLNQYRNCMTNDQMGGPREAREFLSPYLIPVPAQGVPQEVETLWGHGHVTVVRLPLDGGGTATPDEAIHSVKEQLDALDAQALVFLSRADRLVIDIDGKKRILERVVDSLVEVSAHPGFRHECLLIVQSGSNHDTRTIRKFHVWSRVIGGDDDPKQADRIRTVVEHLPNQWPKVRRVTVGVAVEDAPSADAGRIVIFLPTDMATGTGAHINAPFFGSLDRRSIDFGVQYNWLLLESVLDLCLDVVSDLLSGLPEEWRACAVIDLLGSPNTVDGHEWCIMDAVIERATHRNIDLKEFELVLCDHGWCMPCVAREMPEVPGDGPIGLDHWRTRAAFPIVSPVLRGRRPAVRALVARLEGSLDPMSSEWSKTVDNVARAVKDGEIAVGWNVFLNSVVAVLPANMREDPRAGAPDPLTSTRFLPDQDGRLLSVSDPAKLFFQPVRGVDDAADLVEHVPPSLKHRVAFLNGDVETQHGPQQSNTPVQKFLNDRFARSFRREDLIREVVLREIPTLPVAYGGQQAELCSDLLAWTMQILGEHPSSTHLSLLAQLPVACHGGWIHMRDAVFGPGWPDSLGDDIWCLAEELPPNESSRLRRSMLLPPDNPRWGDAVGHHDELFRRMGVVDGLRLTTAPDFSFHMQGWHYELPPTPPSGTPQDAWDEWRRAVHADAQPNYVGDFRYSLSGVSLLPEVHRLDTLTRAGRSALSRLLLASIPQWTDGWQQATIRKDYGVGWTTQIQSPLNYWLSTQPWLTDATTCRAVLSDRWLIPTSLLRGQHDRYRHLDSLSLDLANRLEAKPELKTALKMLGLNVYPMDDERIGPELLEALAAAWTAKRVPVGRFDIFVGQVRDAWQHLDPQKGIPETLLVTTGHRNFKTRAQTQLSGVYLPDTRDRKRSLLAHGEHIVEMYRKDANRLADTLVSNTDIRRSSELEKRVLINGTIWTDEVGDTIPIEESTYAWLPVTLLAIAAHGGNAPTGAATKGWNDAADRLRRARIKHCETISVQLVAAEVVVARSDDLPAEWLHGDVLAVQQSKEMRHADLATATQAILDRQDLVKDLRYVLEVLSDWETPTINQIEDALERAEIDAQAFADIRNRWVGTLSLVVDRIRPLLVLLNIPQDEFDAASSDIEKLTDWLLSNVPQWPASELLSAARKSRDDREMGFRACQVLGDIAQLPAWNAALTTLGDRFAPVDNRSAQDQTAELITMATPLLRCFARHIAIEEANPDLFAALEDVTQQFEAQPDWSVRWWRIPFSAVIDALRTRYTEIPGATRYLTAFENAENIGDLRTALHDVGIETDSDPYEIARQNTKELSSMVDRVQDLHRAWAKIASAGSGLPEHPNPQVSPDPTSYLNVWTETELLSRALRCIGDSQFADACVGCGNLDEVRSRLAVDPAAVEARRQQRMKQEQRNQRQRRTFDVAGIPVEVGTTSLPDVFEHLSRLPAPTGPRASTDSFTELVPPSTSGRSTGHSDASAKTSHSRPPPELRELVGVVGEMHAYRFLRQEFGIESVTSDAWVSEIRQRVLPLVPGEPDNISDSLGFDFRFCHDNRNWYVEVKSTSGDETQFDLGVTEIEAAIRFARPRRDRWRILRVRNALFGQPEFDWLPNPFQDGFKDRFRLRSGGMRVTYKVKDV